MGFEGGCAHCPCGAGRRCQSVIRIATTYFATDVRCPRVSTAGIALSVWSPRRAPALPTARSRPARCGERRRRPARSRRLPSASWRPIRGSPCARPRSCRSARPRRMPARRRARHRSPSSAKLNSTWFRTTSFSTSTPGSSAICSANRRACAQQRSASSTTPARPSERRRRRRRTRAHGARTQAPVDLVAHAATALVLDQIRGLDRHRTAVRLGMRAEHDAGVVRDVEPLVRVRRPRVGELDAGDEVAKPGRTPPRCRSAVDVQPRAWASRQPPRSRPADRMRRYSPRLPGHRRSSAPCRG